MALNPVIKTDKSEIIYGTLGADYIDAKGGLDLIYAKAGDDLINTGRGNDIANSGWGNDTLYFGPQHGADRVQDFSRTVGNNDVIALDESIDTYFVFAESSGIRVVTVDYQDPTGDLKQGSILLSGVTAQEWTNWGGQYGETAFTGDMGPIGNPLIDSDYHLFA
jgi:hypothetical protein